MELILFLSGVVFGIFFYAICCGKRTIKAEDHANNLDKEVTYWRKEALKNAEN